MLGGERGKEKAEIKQGVAAERGRVKGTRVGIESEKGGCRGRTERMEKCGDIAAQRMV